MLTSPTAGAPGAPAGSAPSPRLSVVSGVEDAVHHLAERAVSPHRHDERVAGADPGEGEFLGVAAALGVTDRHFSVEMVHASEEFGDLVAGFPGAAGGVDDEEWRLHAAARR